MSQLSATEKLFGTTTLTEQQATMAKKTYALLGISIVTAILGGYLAVYMLGHNEMVRVFFFKSPTNILAWLLSIVAINTVPQIALWASKRNPHIALSMLALDGLVAGLALGPILFVASNWGELAGQNFIASAMGITGAVFLAVTGYVMVTKKRFSAPTGLILGLVTSLAIAIPLSIFMGVGLLGIAISVGIGILGVVMLVYATSEVLNNPDFNNPVRGAIMLFAALFNIFVSALNLLLSLADGSRK